MRVVVSMFHDLMAMNERIKNLPEPIAYIVLDHSKTAVQQSRDADGKLYMTCSPSILDAVRHERGPLNGVAALGGIPVYRREDMRDGWPGALDVR